MKSEDEHVRRAFRDEVNGSWQLVHRIPTYPTRSLDRLGIEYHINARRCFGSELLCRSVRVF